MVQVSRLQRDRVWIEVKADTVEVWGLTQREYVLAALECLDQAGISPGDLAHASHAGSPARIVADLGIVAEDEVEVQS